MEIHRLAGARIIQRVLYVVIAVLAAVVAQSASVPPVPAKADVESGGDLRHYGYWLHGRTMKSVDVRSMAAQGATDVFLHEHAFKAHGQRDVESWIAKADAAGLKVHIWMQIFYNGNWINPVKDGVPNAALFDEKIGRAQSYARISGVAGIHLDCVRYPGTAYKTPGGADAVSEFVSLAAARLHKTSPRIVVSAALMPETTANLHYYGQDYAAITECLDVVIPMIYKGNYKKTTPWIGSTAKWFVENSKGAKVVSVAMIKLFPASPASELSAGAEELPPHAASESAITAAKASIKNFFMFIPSFPKVFYEILFKFIIYTA